MDLENVEAKNKKEGERKRMKILRKYLPDSVSAGPQFRDPAKG